MTLPSSGNGNGHAGSRPVDRLRFAGGGVLGKAHSGRRFVIGAALGVALVWAGLYAAHRAWKARYAARADVAERQFATVIDPMAEVVPAGVSAADWRGAVRDTHGMLVALVAAGGASPNELPALRADLAGRVAGARPETAVAVLARIWADMERKAGPAVVHAPRDGLLPLPLAINALARATPTDVDPAEWQRALDRTREMLVDVAASGGLDPRRRAALRERLADRVMSATPGTAARLLRRVWDEAEAEAPTVVARHPRPEVARGRDAAAKGGRPEP
jgi:hypothetical protein